MMKCFRAIGNVVAYLLFLTLASSVIVFAALELSPSLLNAVNLDSVRYYAQKKRNVTDEKLVFRPKSKNKTYKTTLNGDLYAIDPNLSRLVQPMALPYVANFEDGFRVNSSDPPFDVVVLGDSFIAIGENDQVTFPELLARESGLSVFNLGRAGYGPYQYELLFEERKHLKPKYALFCFFSGNDIRDTRNYLEFLSGGDYGSYLRHRSVILRYGVALSDSVGVLRKALLSIFEAIRSKLERTISASSYWHKETPKKEKKMPDYIGGIRVGGETVLMRFSYWNTKMDADELIKEREWVSLDAILERFNESALSNGSTPIAIYIPTKLQVYGEKYEADASGIGFVNRISDQLKYERNSLNAFSRLVNKHGILFVDLYHPFKRELEEGRLTFYSFDTHWNSHGRAVAAVILTEAIKRLMSGDPRSVIIRNKRSDV